MAAELPVTRQAVAKHLAVLARAGLIEAHRHGRETRYIIRPERLDEAARAMAHAAARWDTRLRAIKRLAEAKPRPRPPSHPQASSDTIRRLAPRNPGSRPSQEAASRAPRSG